MSWGNKTCISGPPAVLPGPLVPHRTPWWHSIVGQRWTPVEWGFGLPKCLTLYQEWKGEENLGNFSHSQGEHQKKEEERSALLELSLWLCLWGSGCCCWEAILTLQKLPLMDSLETKAFSLYHLHSFSIQSSGWIIYKGARAFNGCLDWVCLHLIAGGGGKETDNNPVFCHEWPEKVSYQKIQCYRWNRYIGIWGMEWTPQKLTLVYGGLMFIRDINVQGSGFKKAQSNLICQDFQVTVFSVLHYRKKYHLNLKSNPIK